jgi:hypothetical protein
MRGWVQPIQASRLPSGDRVGKAKKSEPVTSVRMASGSSAAVPSSGTATIDRLMEPPVCRSCTHQISDPSADRMKSA